MPEPTAVTKAGLLDALRASGREFVETIEAMPASELDAGRYENGWTGRQILAHVAAIEWTYPRLLDIPAQAGPGAKADGPPATEARGGIDSYNERQVAKRDGVPVAELFAEFERNRAATIAAVEAASDAVLAVHVRSAGGRTGPLATVFYDIAVGHVRQHMEDIAGGR
jgi:hypothetical protein